jgi:hypothetical protein
MNNPENTDKTATVAEQGAHAAPEKASSKNGASRKTTAPKSRTTAKGAKGKATLPKKELKAGKKKPTPTTKSASPRAESKGAMILNLIGRPKGATLAEIMKAADWQAHSVRGFLSTARKKRGLKIESVKNDDGVRTYTIKG